MKSSIPDAFQKKLDITEDTDNLFLEILFLECTVCGEDNATKKCRKRHGGCADKRYCDGTCEMLGHVKEKPVEEEENVEAAIKEAIDKAIAKERKKEVRQMRNQNGSRRLWRIGPNNPMI